MIREGSLMDYVERWLDKYPQRAMDVSSKLFCIRDIKEEYKCKIIEAKSIVDSLGSSYPVLADSVILEMGNSVRIEMTGSYRRLLIMVNGEWYKGNMSWLESKDHESKLFPVRGKNRKANRRPQRIEFGAY